MEVVVIVLTMMRSLVVIMIAGSAFAQYPAGYLGAPYSGAPLNGQPQTIPGRLFMGYYDDGGEGVAYHDNDSANQGVPWGNFRPAEAVDVEWTKEDDYWADSAGNKVVPQHVYLIGWTGVGEWVNYTVNIQTAGKYYISGMMSKDTGAIVRNVVIDNKDTIGVIDVSATGWWHTWRYYKNITVVNLPAGRHLVKIYELGEGNMQYFDFDVQGSGANVPPAPPRSRQPALRTFQRNGRAVLNFSLEFPGKVTACICDMEGKRLLSFDKEYTTAGSQAASFDVSRLSQGVYVVGLKQNGVGQTAVMKIIR
jgi:hypothetical protein